jgi:hypothetical protein
MNSSFYAYIELLQAFLVRRDEIVAGIDRLLNCQKKPIEYQQNFALLSQQFTACFLPPGGPGYSRLNLMEQLEQAHWASGFKPRETPGNDLFDPVEQMMRGLHMWRETRWPGQKGRVRYAHTLFNLYVLRCLALLCMRVWDDDKGGASGRLSQAQQVLDELWKNSPADQPRLVRHVHWLFPVVMSPTTDSLAGYFQIAQLIAETFAEEDRIETHKAWVQTGAGHLRSQLRHLAVQRQVALDDNGLVLITRMSNALDIALLMQGLVTLLEAYEHCLQSGDEPRRLELAAAISQGISPDPELFINRLDLLGPYSMIEYLFITTDSEGQVVYTAAGRRHLVLLQQYAALIRKLVQPLYEDCQRCAPVQGKYSPYGILYGFSSRLIELMAFKTLERDAATHFSLEDGFTEGDTEKLAWVNGWRNLPHIKPEVLKQFEYPRQFAEDIHTRIEQALHLSVAEPDAKPVAGRLCILSDDVLQTDVRLAQIPDLPLRYVVSSDSQLVAANRAEAKDQEDLLHCRVEGEFVVSYSTEGGWVGITKDMLTDVLGAGNDAKVGGLPRVAGEVLGLMCPGLIVLPAAEPK